MLSVFKNLIIKEFNVIGIYNSIFSKHFMEWTILELFKFVIILKYFNIKNFRWKTKKEKGNKEMYQKWRTWLQRHANFQVK